MCCLPLMAYLGYLDYDSFLVSLYSSNWGNNVLTVQNHRSLIIIGISVFYSYLLHYIKDYDRHVAAAIYSSTQQGRRDRDGSPAETGLIPPIPTAYGGIEVGALNRIGV